MRTGNKLVAALALLGAGIPAPSFADSTAPGNVYLDQIPPGFPPIQSSGNGNTAAIEQQAILGTENTAAIQQNGMGGTVNLTQQGQQNDVAVTQSGLGDKANASQYGNNLGVQINQYGNGSSIGVMQFGTGATGGAPIAIKQF
jgi:hypothetical protein